MKKNVKWTKFLTLSILGFGAFLLEYFALFVIEMLILGMDLQNYTAGQRSIHHLLMAVIWSMYIWGILYYSKKHYDFPANTAKRHISVRNWAIAILCLLACKVMTFIDWHTLKVIGEARGKDIPQFTAQYLYYVLEVGMVLLIIVYGQKAFETLRKKESAVPYGGILLAFTWGLFHFVSRGVGIELWNGVSCMIFSVLSGIMYLKLGRNCIYSYLLIAVGYLL